MEKYRLKTGLREQTILKDVFFTPPFNLVEVRENKKNPLLEVMVMSSSPGMLNDDVYDIHIDVINHSQLNLQTQSYQRIYVSKNGTKQRMQVDVGEGAYFSHVPHPMVPHAGAIYFAENTLALTKSSTLLWGEILTCGRKWMEKGEQFTFKKHHTITTIRVEGKTIFKDNLFLLPAALDITEMGQYEGFTHQGSLFFIAPEGDIKKKMDDIHDRLASEADIDFGISLIRENAYVLRVLGNSGERLFRIFDQIRKEEDENINRITKASCLQN
ncbi:urease accessory protein UreD [Echinicola strongylocentroti]|nr:urease accessory protein UreD [Echinicola strongylocentroti]